MYHYFTDLDFRWTMQGGLKMLSILLDSIKLNESFPLLSIRHAGSRFARDFKHIAPLDNARWVKNVVNSTRFDQIDWSLWPRFKNEEGSCIIISRILTSGGLCRVAWKCCRFDSIRPNQHKSFPPLSIRHARSRFARDATPCESSRVVKCLWRIDSVWVYWTWIEWTGIRFFEQIVLVNVFTAQTGHWKWHVFAICRYDSPPATSEDTTKIMTRWGYE